MGNRNECCQSKFKSVSCFKSNLQLIENTGKEGDTWVIEDINSELWEEEEKRLKLYKKQGNLENGKEC